MEIGQDVPAAAVVDAVEELRRLSRGGCVAPTEGEMKMQETPQQYIQRILGHVDGEDALTVQKSTPAKLKKLVRGLTPKQVRWRPEPGKWSIGENPGAPFRCGNRR